MSDLTDGFWDRKAYPWELLLGSSQSSSINEQLTPADALISFLAFALLMISLTWALVLCLDLRCYPSLNDASTECAGTAALKIQDVVHRYGWLQGSAPAQVLNGVSFTVSPGEVLGMLGPNGAGKTTCIRCIVGEEVPTSGSVAVNSCFSKCGTYIGFCPQETVVIPDLTVAENLLLFAYIRGASAIEAAHFLESMLTASCLTQKRNWMPDTLSGGMRRRLAVTCALIGSPAVAILDEPTTGLDPVSKRGIWDTIQDSKLSGSCCLLTTHMLEEAEALCSKLVILRRGEIVASGTVQELKEQWGTGYCLNIDSKPGEQEVAKQFVAACLPDYVPEADREPIKSTSNGQMTFKVNVTEEVLGQLIITIAQNKEKGGILRWGLSQASLEDAYLRIIDSPQEALTAEIDQPVESA